MSLRKVIAALCAGLLVLLAAGCGSSGGGSSSSTAGSAAASAVPAGLTISGPGLQEGVPAGTALQAAHPAWAPEYAHLAQRLKQLGLPPGGKETFHIHALLHIYVDGLLVPVAPNVGLDPAKGLESSLHTHDSSGVIHMEAPHPFKYTLGDFFAVWGVKFGPAQLGGLKGYGGDKLHFYVNGRTLANPAAYVLHDNDSVVIGYGAPSSFPHTPSTIVLKEVEGKGGAALACSRASKGHPAKSCLAAKPAGGASSGAASKKK